MRASCDSHVRNLLIDRASISTYRRRCLGVPPDLKALPRLAYIAKFGAHDAQQEPSAKAPCTSTILSIAIVLFLFELMLRDGKAVTLVVLAVSCSYCVYAAWELQSKGLSLGYIFAPVTPVRQAMNVASWATPQANGYLLLLAAQS